MSELRQLVQNQAAEKGRQAAKEHNQFEGNGDVGRRLNSGLALMIKG